MAFFNYIPTLKESDWETLQSELNKELDDETKKAVQNWANQR